MYMDMLFIKASFRSDPLERWCGSQLDRRNLFDLVLFLWTNINLILHVSLTIPGSSSGDAFFKTNLGSVTQQALCLANISASVWNITWLVRKDLAVCSLSSVLFNQGNEFSQGCTIALAQVENLVGVRTVNSTGNTIDNIGNVGVVAGGGSITELLYLSTTADAVNELKW